MTLRDPNKNYYEISESAKSDEQMREFAGSCFRKSKKEEEETLRYLLQSISRLRDEKALVYYISKKGVSCVLAEINDRLAYFEKQLEIFKAVRKRKK